MFCSIRERIKQRKDCPLLALKGSKRDTENNGFPLEFIDVEEGAKSCTTKLYEEDVFQMLQI